MLLKPGSKAPELNLVGTDLKAVHLEDFTGRTLIIHFFPLAFTSVCTAQMCTAQTKKNDYSQLNAEIIGVSVDSPFVLQKFAQENQLNFKLASDFNRTTCEAYGVLFTDDFMGLSMFAKRSAFVVDSTGIISYAEITDGKSLPDFDAIKSVL